ncbi:hypothetical protein BO94DRAFT_304310 [Aspergillus sclerotioniger CBS 115572]|uniref:Uncharacterized protein n=1 Tax=Aspergillus sclerotioniger CBS 115572 TaxID=1450535 RepID=A0A317V398_9EURO|nr:hypothetical protein BO94DRAFT_304310 [Aspergillus sclerotioniger CBS 115572]PWY68119.1 hypothetical protein BO94DRAFT_304310 [Aspergillus sclerotioniger CBS 115572]
MARKGMTSSPGLSTPATHSLGLSVLFLFLFLLLFFSIATQRLCHRPPSGLCQFFGLLPPSVHLSPPPLILFSSSPPSHFCPLFLSSSPPHFLCLILGSKIALYFFFAFKPCR